jgi:hypothetical protein
MVLLALLALVPAGCALPEQRLEPLVRGWEQYFRLEWEGTERAGQPLVRGYITNTWGFGASDIRLLAEGLDASGAVVSQDVGWLGAELPPGTRAYFEVPVRRASPTYRVSVFAFTWIQSGNGSGFR